MMTIWDVADSRGNVRLADLAREAGVDRRTARKWVDAGLIPARCLPHSNILIIKAHDVEVFMRSLTIGRPANLDIS